MLKTLFSATTTTSEWPTEQASLIDRIKSAFVASDKAHKSDEIGAFIEAHGGVLTDDLERQISRRFGQMAGK